MPQWSLINPEVTPPHPQISSARRSHESTQLSSFPDTFVAKEREGVCVKGDQRGALWLGLCGYASRVEWLGPR
eukprot:3602580-Rhodomonas_salina.1